MVSDLPVPSEEGISWPHSSAQGLDTMAPSWCVISHLPGMASSPPREHGGFVPRVLQKPGSISLPTPRLRGVRGNTQAGLPERMPPSRLLGTEESRQVASTRGRAGVRKMGGGHSKFWGLQRHREDVTIHTQGPERTNLECQTDDGPVPWKVRNRM